MNDIINDFELAKEAMKNSHDPYTDHHVRAVLTAKASMSTPKAYFFILY